MKDEVLYSNHLGYSTVGGGTVPERLFADLLNGLLKLNIQKEVSTIITGYMGTVEQIRATSAFIQALRKQNPKVKYICDPVMGDTDKGLYVQEEIPETIVKCLVPLADLVTPNLFEFRQIVGEHINSINEIQQTLPDHSDIVRKMFLVTGCRFGTHATPTIETLIIQNADIVSVSSKAVDLNPPGTGELFTAHMQLMLLKGIPLYDAVTKVVKIIEVVLAKMLLEGRTEFELSDMLFSMKQLVD